MAPNSGTPQGRLVGTPKASPLSKRPTLAMLLRSGGCLDLFEPCDDPLIFAADLTGMKREHPLLCIHGRARRIGQLL